MITSLRATKDKKKEKSIEKNPTMDAKDKS